MPLRRPHVRKGKKADLERWQTVRKFPPVKVQSTGSYAVYLESLKHSVSSVNVSNDDEHMRRSREREREVNMRLWSANGIN